MELAARRRTNTGASLAPPCSTPDCLQVTQPGGCSNRAQRRPSSPVERHRQTESELQSNRDGSNRTKALEMASCVRSGDCAAGLCCVRYLTGRRCQRIPVDGEACLLRGFNKLRRKLGRCDCDTGLTCSAISRAESGGKNKGQGVCQARNDQSQNTRHSGKKRRTAETSC
ncbi:Dickkopf-related protein 1 [Takifugu flavidus]|uniref:Dickkopf-related protein 1 n=2 Tax=Takifugu flavidus TaxID=433684 RepID=A0A5C6N0V1_9TELE|nr:Dickkopf-related protein 1 [Takifugu flavidus]